MIMKGYSQSPPEQSALARVEGVNASYKDLAQVCGVIRDRNIDWAVVFLESAAAGESPVFFRRHNKNLGHRRELGGRQGRYPEKAAKMVLNVLKSAIANSKILGLGDKLKIAVATANKKMTYPRMASKGRQARSYLETSRVEIILVPTSGKVTAENTKVAKVEKTEAPKKAPLEKKAESAPKKADVPQKEVVKKSSK